MGDSEEKSSKWRDLILNTRVPLVLHKFSTQWQCFQGSFEDWCKTYDATATCLPVFDRMDIEDSWSPQWERKRKQITMTMEQFLLEHLTQQPHWSAYNYKRASEIPSKCLEGIDLSCFGFPSQEKDFTFWLGSAGANTPCHYDSFGVNIVVQIYGRKSWLLFPPETPLQSTRIPYEESSVYCEENFYAPDPSKLAHYEKFLPNAHHCILEPGDVLIVPRHWWHYVEAVETSLTVNYWVPLKCDMDVTLDEMIVKHLIESFVRGEDKSVHRYLLNPNQLNEILETPSELFADYERAVQHADSGERKVWDYEYLSETEVLRNIDVPSVEQLKVMEKVDYFELLNTNAKRFRANDKANDSSPLSATAELMINAICGQRTIACIKNEFFTRLRQKD